MNSDNKQQGTGGTTGCDLEADRFYHGMALEPRHPIFIETTLFAADTNEVYCLYCDFSNHSRLVIKSSGDSGRTWGEPWTLKDGQGQSISGFHATIVRTRSGLLGLIYSAKLAGSGHRGRDGGTVLTFRSSEDEGHTWSDATLIDEHFALCCSGHAMVLSTGRIVAPAFAWISPFPGNEAEAWILPDGEPSPTFSYSFVYTSDDEGKTWRRSLSELFISVRRAAYDLEEPSVVELKDGRLLMHLRNQTGRIYRSWSTDGGTSWSRPEMLHVATSNTPCLLSRIPSTGDILMVWNQTSRQEIVTGLERHRISCAISSDEGGTWAHFKNLESLDDVAELTPPPAHEVFAYQPYEDGYSHQPPSDMSRYHRAPGVIRICYPSTAFIGDEAIVAYDYGFGVLGKKSGTKLRVIPVSWFSS